MKAVIVSVNYGDFLKWTLPYNRERFERVVVVTSTTDETTAEVAASNDAEVIRTDIWTANGARFAKYAGLDLGLDLLGRDGWLCVMDADIMLPKTATWDHLRCGLLYSPFRRMCRACPPPPESEWHRFPRDPVAPPWHYLGYMQVFHASDPHLQPPWFGTGHRTAARGDMILMERWPRELRARTGWSVLHLGEERRNWTGRVTGPYR